MILSVYPPDRRLAAEQKDEWAVHRARCLSLETFVLYGDNSIVRLPLAAVWIVQPALPGNRSYTTQWGTICGKLSGFEVSSCFEC